MRVVYDANGMRLPEGVELADVPGSGVSNVAPGTPSGNPRHDTRSGKFGSGGGKQRAPTIPTPANVDPLEFGRMTDAVRDAARQFDDFDEGDAQEFLAARARDPDAVDLQAFLDMVRQQHVTDLVDIIDQQLRSSGIKPFGRRTVKVTAPRGYVRKTVKNLSDDEVAQIMHRLESRGHDAKDVDRWFDTRRPANGDAKGKRNAVQASDWSADLLEEATIELETSAENQEGAVQLAIALAEKIATSMPAPQVEVHPVVNVHMPGEKAKKIIRNERGLITDVQVVDDGD